MSQSLSKLMIVDGNALLHRAWHALPQTMKAPNGKITNAAYGFILILFKALRDLCPTHLAVCFDAPGPTFRDKLYKEYKAGREKKPQDLYDQIPMIQEMLHVFGVKSIQKQGVEADDVIGTLCRNSKLKTQTCLIGSPPKRRNSKLQLKTKNFQSIIVTGDMDTLQLVDENTKVYGLKKGISETLIYDIEEVKKKYGGLAPAQLVDFKALRGDPSDNIPGAKGIGEKTAIELLTKFKSIEKIYKQLQRAGSAKSSQISGIKETVFKKLIDSEKLVKLSQELAQIKTDVKIKIDFDELRFGKFDPEKIVKILQKYAFRSLIAQIQTLADLYQVKSDGHLNKSQAKYILIDNEEKMEKFLIKLRKQKEVAFDVETDGLDVVSAKPVGISFCWNRGEAYYVSESGINKHKLLIKQVLKDEKVRKIGHNLKFDYQVLKNIGINVKNIYFDTMIAAYLINPGQRVYSLDSLAFQYFGYNMQKIESPDFTWALYQKINPEIAQKNLNKVLFDIEMPLVPILGDMERAGIKLDAGVLRRLDKKVKFNIHQLELKIHQLAGKKFNIASPKQLKEILFDKLKISISGIRKTKTGISTAASELEKMRSRHPIISHIFDYRELAKLKSTYIDALPSLKNPKTGRIHTSFNQVVTTTGRLSSSNPNMQNIPIRTDLGREIRRAFIAEQGYQLLSLDYSQIDLRMAAHLSCDKNMISAFEANQDIHTVTAARLFNVNFSEVDKDQRRKAKEANFGVLYGLGPKGLSERMGVDFGEAQEFIDRYQALYPQVFAFLDRVIVETRKTGYAQTLYGRRRYLPEINSGSPVMRAAAERAAINMPVQGTAADIIKIAMINIDQNIKCQMTEIKMLLQVHDELVFEVKENRVDYWAEIIKKEMESAAKLRVPLKVEAKTGNNWKEMKIVDKCQE